MAHPKVLLLVPGGMATSMKARCHDLVHHLTLVKGMVCGLPDHAQPHVVRGWLALKCHVAAETVCWGDARHCR